MVFPDRKAAAEKLAKALGGHKGRPDSVVVALPRGGVVLGRVIADALGLPLDLVAPRKIGAKRNEEYAIGAVTASGDAAWNEQERGREDPAYLERAVEAERRESARRLALYREGMPPSAFRGKTVIIVDDGMATGLTMRAAVAAVRAAAPARIIVAVPVSSTEAAGDLRREADEVIALSTPLLFGAVGQFYGTFEQVEDDEVVSLMAPERQK